jgi:4-alpha-glucanotransferase
MEAAGNTIIIAEDLGMTPPYVPRTLEELDIAGFTIPHFQKDKKTDNFIPASEFHKRTVATWGTHDHAPVKDWYEDLATRWHGPDGHQPWLELQRIMRFIGWDENKPPRTFTKELHAAMLNKLLTSPAEWIIFTICDILNLDIRFNMPGTAGGLNWSQRLAGPMEDFFANPVTDEILTEFKKVVVESGRAIPPVERPVYEEQAEPEQQELGEYPEEEVGEPEPDIEKLEAEARALLIERELAEKSSKIELPKVERPKD